MGTHDIEVGGTPAYTFNHPLVGLIRVNVERFAIISGEGQLLIVHHTDPASPSERALLRLADLTAVSVPGGPNTQLTSGLNDLSWVLLVLGAFLAAMFVMSGAFGLWRAGIISKTFFSAGVTAVVLVLAGATTWASDGVWAPDGAYARFVAPIIAVVWIAVVSGFLYRRRPATVSTSARAAVPAT